MDDVECPIGVNYRKNRLILDFVKYVDYSFNRRSMFGLMIVNLIKITWDLKKIILNKTHMLDFVHKRHKYHGHRGTTTFPIDDIHYQISYR